MKYLLTALWAIACCFAAWAFDRWMDRRYGHDYSWRDADPETPL